MKKVLLIFALSLLNNLDNQAQISTGFSFSHFKTSSGEFEEKWDFYQIKITARITKNEYLKYFFCFTNIRYKDISSVDFSIEPPIFEEYQNLDYCAGIGASTEFYQLINTEEFWLSPFVSTELSIAPGIKLSEAKVGIQFWTNNRNLRLQVFAIGMADTGISPGIHADYFFTKK